MTKTTYIIEIQRPAKEVFAYIDDSEQVTQWLSGVVKIEPLTNGGNRVGAKSRHTYNENGRTFEMVEETLVYEPNRRVKLKGVTDAFELTAEYTLTDLGGRTRIDFQSDITFKNVFFRLLSPFLLRDSQNRVASDFQQLKRLVEEQ